MSSNQVPAGSGFGALLRRYRRSVRALADALGLTQPEREELDRASRSGAGASPVPVAPLSPADGSVTVPRQLSAPVAHFVGRSAELTALTYLLDQRDADAPGTVVISATGGTAGVGNPNHRANTPDRYQFVT